MDHQQEAFVELESTWELLHDLPHALDKLREHRGRFFSVHWADEATTISKLVTKW